MTWYTLGLLIATMMYNCNISSEDCLHPCLYNYTGNYKNESYYYYSPNLVNIMYDKGYDYDYWVRNDGVQMFGDYVIVAANPDMHTYGDIIDTSLGKGIVCDIGGVSDKDYIDIGTLWR